MNPFKKLLATFNLGKLTAAGATSDWVVGVDIGSSSIKLVELRKKNGKAVLETYSTLALGPYAGLDIGATTNLAPDVFAKAITDAIREGNIGAKAAAFSIPSSASLIFLLDLPSGLAEKDLPDIVPTEARKYIPVPISEVTLDYWVIPHEEASELEAVPGEAAGENAPQKTEVLVAAIHNETLARYRALAEASGLSADTFEIEVFSAIRSTFLHELSAVLLLDFGASKTKLAIVEYGIVKSFHVINRGSFDVSSNIAKSLGISFDKAESFKRDTGLSGVGTDKQASDVAHISVDYIMTETSAAISAFERKYNKAISKIILSGAGVLMPGFRELVEATFRVETVTGNPFNRVEVPEFIAKVLAETGPEFAIALGLALRKLG